MPIFQQTDRRFLNPAAAWLALFLVTAAFSLLIGREFWLLKNDLRSLVKAEAAGPEAITKIPSKSVLYTLDFGNGDIKSYLISPSTESTAFSLLQELASKENFKLEFTVYKDMGVLVENINGRKGGTENKYWQYWVNGSLAEVASDKKTIKSGDRIEWKFEITPF